MTVLITLTTAGTDSGPFNLYSNVDGYVSAFETGVSKSALLAGYSSALVPNGSTTIRVKSTGVCTNYIDITLVTTTTTTTTAALPTISLGSPLCRNNNCNDNAFCSVVYNINTTNAPVGSYITVQTDPPPSGASVSIQDNNPTSGKLYYQEPNGLQPAVFFTLQLRDSGGSVIASSSTSLIRQSFWQFLPLCSSITTTTTTTTTAAPSLSISSLSYTIEQVNITDCQAQFTITLLGGNVSQNTDFDFQYQLFSTGSTLYFGTVTILAGQNSGTALVGGASPSLCEDAITSACVNTVTGDPVSIGGFSC